MPSAEMNKSSTKGGTSVMTPCANNVQLAYILFILHGSSELKPRKQLHHCGFPLGRPTLAVPPAPPEAEMSCHSPLRPRPLKRRCPATLRSSRHSSKVLRVIPVFILAQSGSESN